MTHRRQHAADEDGRRTAQAVISQDEAIKAIAKAVRRSRSGLKDPQAADRLLHLRRSDRRR